MKEIRAVVRGWDHFPIDMLRYDCAYPDTGEDATKIGKSFYSTDNWTITIAKKIGPGSSSFNPARWASFNCTIEEIGSP